MAQGLGSELFNLYSAADPLGSFRKGQMDVQKYDIQQANLDEQTKELNAERQQSLNGAKTGQPLQGMANQLLPGAKLYDDSGVLTVAGQMNEMLANSMKLAKQGQQMVRLAATVDDPVQQAQVMAEGRRMIQNAQQDSQKAQQLHQNTQNDAIYAAATAQNPQQWDNAIKAYQASGLPLPQGIPTEYSPENVKKIQALAPAALQSKINNDLLKREQDRRAEDRADRLARKDVASERDGISGKLPPTKDERESYVARHQTVENISDIQTLLEDPKYSKLINPTTKFTPQLIANLQENFPELSQKLARIQAIEFQLGGKALTATEQKILEPLYGWRGLTVKALKQRISGVQSDFEKRNKMEEALYPGLKGVAKKFDEIYDRGDKPAEKKSSPSSGGDAKSQAEAAIAAGAPRDAVAKKYKELTGKDL